MKTMAADRQRGASLLELAVAAIVAALLAGVLLNCLVRYQGESERVASKQLIGSLRTALAVRSAKAIMTTGEQGLMAITHQNPMTWLQYPPQNYLGEYYSPKKEALEPGNWYFDRAAGTLVYIPAAEKSFSSGIQKVQVFKVKLVRVSSPVNTRGRDKGSSGLVLDQMDDQAVASNNLAGSFPRHPLSEKK